VNHDRQAGPHAHYITADPANRFALVCDLGLDKVLVYHLDAAKGVLTANDPPSLSVKPGSGPRHLAFHPAGKFAYLLNEMGWTLNTLKYDSEHGTLTELESLQTLPEGFSRPNSSAEVQVHPSGRFVYASNRGDNSIALFSVNAETGKLTFVERQSTQGKTPRYFGIDPSGNWLLAANQDSDSVVVLRIDPTAGRLTPSGHNISVVSPVCLQFVPAK
jgi:6-phosphogluconolactonase